MDNMNFLNKLYECHDLVLIIFGGQITQHFLIKKKYRSTLIKEKIYALSVSKLNF